MRFSLFNSAMDETIDEIFDVALGCAIAGGTIGYYVSKHLFSLIESKCVKALLITAGTATGAIVCGVAGQTAKLYCINR